MRIGKTHSPHALNNSDGSAFLKCSAPLASASPLSPTFDIGCLPAISEVVRHKSREQGGHKEDSNEKSQNVESVGALRNRIDGVTSLTCGRHHDKCTGGDDGNRSNAR